MKKPLEVIILTLAILIALSGLGSLIYFSNINYDLFKLNNLESLNELGDFFSGFIGALFSLSAVLLIFITYMSQKTELKEQRDEFRRSRTFDLVYKEIEHLGRIFEQLTIEAKIHKDERTWPKAVNYYFKAIEREENKLIGYTIKNEFFEINKENFQIILGKQSLPLINFVESLSFAFKNLELILEAENNKNIYYKIACNNLPENLSDLLAKMEEVYNRCKGIFHKGNGDDDLRYKVNNMCDKIKYIRKYIKN